MYPINQLPEGKHNAICHVPRWKMSISHKVLIAQVTLAYTAKQIITANASKCGIV